MSSLEFNPKLFQKKMIKEVVLTGAAKSIVINDLDINADGGVYDVVLIGAGLTSSSANPGSMSVYYNEDTVDSNYGYRRIYASSNDNLTTDGGDLPYGGYVYRVATLNNMCIALSGQHPVLYTSSSVVSITNIESLNYMQYCKNPKSNITSLRITTINNMGVGTKVQVYKR